MSKQGMFGVAVKVWVPFKGSRKLLDKLCKNKGERVRMGEDGPEIQIEKTHWIAERPEPKVETEYNSFDNESDGCHLESCEKFAPGSKERIAALAEFYQNHDNERNNQSAFVQTLEENSDELARKWQNGDFNNKGGNIYSQLMNDTLRIIGLDTIGEDDAANKLREKYA
jgi:hypothetical protein